MPCFQMTKVKSKISTKNFRLLLQAAEDMNFTYEIKGRGKILTIKTTNYDRFRFDLEKEEVEFDQWAEKSYNKLKREYARKVIGQVASKKRWALSGSGNSFSVQKY